MALLRGLIFAVFSAIVLSEKYSVYRINPQTTEALLFLEELTKDNEIDFWKEPGAVDQEVDAMIPAHKATAILDQLRSRNISFAVMIEDVESVIKNQKAAHLKRKSSLKEVNDSKVEFNLAEYHSYSDVVNYLDTLASTYPHLVSIYEIGVTHEGRSIQLIKITNNNVTEHKRTMWIDGGIHAREWISPATVLYFIHELINKYEKDSIIRRYVDEIEWNLVPILNPDGYEYSRSSTDSKIRGWRKNRSPTKCRNETEEATCCPGVDLNRNFDWHFGEASSSDPCAITYHGEFAFSEPESRAVRDFITSNPITTYVSLHSFSQFIIYPYSHKNDTYSEDLNDHLVTAILASNALRSVYGTNYAVGTAADLLYRASGSSEDWTKGKAGVKYSFTFELRPGVNQDHDFLLPEDQILPTGRETWEAIKVIANRTLEVPFD